MSKRKKDDQLRVDQAEVDEQLAAIMAPVGDHVRACPRCAEDVPHVTLSPGRTQCGGCGRIASHEPG